MGKEKKKLRRLSPQQLPSNRSFGFVFTAFFSLLGISEVGWDTFWYILAALFAMLAVFLPHFLTPINRIWMKLGNILHVLISPIVLGVIFFLVISPVALMMRLMGRDPMRRRFQPEMDSYWINRTPSYSDVDDLKQQF